MPTTRRTRKSTPAAATTTEPTTTATTEPTTIDAPTVTTTDSTDTATPTGEATVTQAAPTDAAPTGPAAEGHRTAAALTTVDLSRAILREVCPTCNRPMPRRNTVNVSRTAGPARAGLNNSGQRVLGKNELRDIVRVFLAEHPGHEFTAGDISKEIN